MSVEESVVQSLQNFGFFVTAAVMLVFLTGDQPEESEEENDYLEDLLPSSSCLINEYAFLLKDLDKKHDFDDRMPTFQEMMQRRSFGVDDIRGLDLISDRRLQSSYELAVERVCSPVLSEGTAETEFTCSSWDIMAA